MRIRVQFPQGSTNSKPYELRIIQGWCKQPLVGKKMSSAAGTTGMNDGICLNFDPNGTAEGSYTAHVRNILNDNLGTQNGNQDVKGVVNSQSIKVISDQKRTMMPQVADDGSYSFGTYDQVFNFKTGQYMRLFPFTAGAAIPQSGLPDGLTPINNPKLWIPFVALCLLNYSEYTVAAERPIINADYNHFWCNL